MTYLLQVDFKMEGPFGEEMSKGFAELAQSINDEPGMIGKFGQKMRRQKKLEASIYSKQKKRPKPI